MQCFLVGGAVRDKLLGLDSTDNDWVVVGATEEMMLQKKFKKIGRSFPVFIHPHTKEEYALARSETKAGKSYQDFKVSFSEKTTLYEDLIRRDLTINALAIQNGEIIDHFNGLADLKERKLKHISPAFCDDPLRIIRIARFKAKLHELNFTIDEKTLKLINTMVANGELKYIKKERFLLEIKKSFNYRIDVFFAFLHEINALKYISKTIADNFNLLADENFILNIEYKNKPIDKKIAMFFYKLKNPDIKKISNDLKISKDLTKLMTFVVDCYSLITNNFNDNLTILNFLKTHKALNQQIIFIKNIEICKSIFRIEKSKSSLRKVERLKEKLNNLTQIDYSKLTKNSTKDQIPQKIFKKQIKVLNK